MLAGDHVAAERDLRRDAELLEAMGERYLLSTMEGVRAQALIALGRHGDAADACARAEAAAAEDDVESQVLVRSVRAELHLHEGRFAEAATAAAEADALLRGAEAPNIVADLAVVRARIAAAGGDRETAGRELARAARLYRDKGNVVAEGRTAEVRAVLGLGPVTA
jgi:ATP/maltotriose-dependent transcriptional regulator MalT